MLFLHPKKTTYFYELQRPVSTNVWKQAFQRIIKDNKGIEHKTTHLRAHWENFQHFQQDSLEGHPSLKRLYLRNNPLGIMGLPEFSEPHIRASTSSFKVGDVHICFNSFR